MPHRFPWPPTRPRTPITRTTQPARWLIALLAQQAGDLNGARQFLQQAALYHRAALKANSRNPSYGAYYRTNLQLLGAIELSRGNHAAAAAAADALAGVHVDAVDDAYSAACLLALCVPLAQRDTTTNAARRTQLARNYADRAIRLLRQAVAAGYTNAAQMNEDRDLAALRDRDDFKKLIAHLRPSAAGRRADKAPKPAVCVATCIVY